MKNFIKVWLIKIKERKMKTKVRKTKESKLVVGKASKIDERNFKKRKEAINIRDENTLFSFVY